MGRGYAVKGRKKKRKLHEAAASDAGPPAEEAEELPLPEEAGGEDQGKDEEAAAGEEEKEHAAVEGLPIVPRPVDGKRRPGAIFVLEKACLEVGKVGKVQWLGFSKKLLCFIVLFHSEFVLSLLGDYVRIGFRLVLFSGVIGLLKQF